MNRRKGKLTAIEHNIYTEVPKHIGLRIFNRKRIVLSYHFGRHVKNVLAENDYTLKGVFHVKPKNHKI